jgi:hypothetical protein
LIFIDGINLPSKWLIKHVKWLIHSGSAIFEWLSQVVNLAQPLANNMLISKNYALK